MRRDAIRCASITLALLSIGQIAAAATEPLVLKPASKWYVDYGDDSCKLARDFSSGKDAIILVVERFGPGDPFRLLLVGKSMIGFEEGYPAKVRFGPAETLQSITYFKGDLGKEKPAIIFRGSMRIAAATDDELKRLKAAPTNQILPYDPILPERESAVTFLEIGRRGKRTTVLDTGSMGKPFTALRQCTDDLMKTWDVDPVKYAKQTRPALPVKSPNTWFTDQAYPSAAIMKGRRGIVNFRLSVDETGKATACHIQQSTSAKDFDGVVCKTLMRRARFDPALDDGGKPMASFYRSMIIFDIPQ